MDLLLMSDLHGILPEVITPSEVVVIAGDIVPLQYNNQTKSGLIKSSMWLKEKFFPWCEQLPTSNIVMVWGNHDWIGQYDMEGKAKNSLLGSLLPPVPPFVHILTDKGITLWEDGDGDLGGGPRPVTFWGSPWQPPFHDWAFNLPEEQLKEKWDLIPTNTDVLVLHGPPYMAGDRVGKTHVGSLSLRVRIEQLQPKLVVCGHIHVGHGKYMINNTVVHNVALVDENYKPKWEPLRYEV